MYYKSPSIGNSSYANSRLRTTDYGRLYQNRYLESSSNSIGKVYDNSNISPSSHSKQGLSLKGSQETVIKSIENIKHRVGINTLEIVQKYN